MLNIYNSLVAFTAELGLHDVEWFVNSSIPTDCSTQSLPEDRAVKIAQILVNALNLEVGKDQVSVLNGYVTIKDIPRFLEALADQKAVEKMKTLALSNLSKATNSSNISTKNYRTELNFFMEDDFPCLKWSYNITKYCYRSHPLTKATASQVVDFIIKHLNLTLSDVYIVDTEKKIVHYDKEYVSRVIVANSDHFIKAFENYLTQKKLESSSKKSNELKKATSLLMSFLANCSLRDQTQLAKYEALIEICGRLPVKDCIISIQPQKEGEYLLKCRRNVLRMEGVEDWIFHKKISDENLELIILMLE